MNFGSLNLVIASKRTKTNKGNENSKKRDIAFGKLRTNYGKRRKDK